MDAGTRPDLVTAKMVMPGSLYLSGAQWMKLSIEEAAEKGFIKLVKKIKLDNDSKIVLKEGVLFNNLDDDQLEDGCFPVSIINSVNIDKMVEREICAEYLYSPLKRNFSSLQITALVLIACRRFIK